MSNFNIYCDESCHLEHDGINFMVVVAAWDVRIRSAISRWNFSKQS